METNYLQSCAFYITETEEHVQLYQNNGPDTNPTLLAKVPPSYYRSIKKTIEERLHLGELEPQENKGVPLKRFRESSSMNWRMGRSICVLFWVHEYIRDDKELQYVLQTWSRYSVVNLNYLFDMMRWDCFPDDPTASIGGWRAAVYIALSGITLRPKGLLSTWRAMTGIARLLGLPRGTFSGTGRQHSCHQSTQNGSQDYQRVC